MKIIVDTREKAGAIRRILAAFDKMEIEYCRRTMHTGDYMLEGSPGLVIDRKQNLSELASNLSRAPKKDERGRIKKYKDGREMCEFERFRAELKRAADDGISLVILCEHGPRVKCLEDVIKWENPRLKESPFAMSGERMYKTLVALSEKYGVRYEFCNKCHTGKRIMEILLEG